MHWGSLIEVNIDTPNLCKFAYCGRNVIPFSSNALALLEVSYQMQKPPLDIAPWNVEKIEFLTKLGKSKQLTLISTSAKVFLLSFIWYIFSSLHHFCTSFIHIRYIAVIWIFFKGFGYTEEIERFPAIPINNVKQLKVETSHPRTGQEIVELVDSLLWISPLPEILIIRHRINKEPGMTFKVYQTLIS